MLFFFNIEELLSKEKKKKKDGNTRECLLIYKKNRWEYMHVLYMFP
jgi:hypothetical protein